MKERGLSHSTKSGFIRIKILIIIFIFSCSRNNIHEKDEKDLYKIILEDRRINHSSCQNGEMFTQDELIYSFNKHIKYSYPNIKDLKNDTLLILDGVSLSNNLGCMWLKGRYGKNENYLDYSGRNANRKQKDFIFFQDRDFEYIVINSDLWNIEELTNNYTNMTRGTRYVLSRIIFIDSEIYKVESVFFCNAMAPLLLP